MVTAWDFPRNPLTDATLDDSKLSNEIRSGIPDLHEHTGRSRAVHAEQGLLQQLPSERWTTRAVAAACRRGRDVSRIQPALGPALHARRPDRRLLPAKRECHGPDRALRAANRPATRTWRRCRRQPRRKCWPWPPTSPGWRAAPRSGRIPRGAARTSSPRRTCFRSRSSMRTRARRSSWIGARSCHGVDGQGVAVGDKKPGPLWGPDSWNDGAGAARVYTLAGIIRYSMPYLDPGSLTDEEAQQVAAFIDSQAASRRIRSSRRTIARRSCRSTACTTRSAPVERAGEVPTPGGLSVLSRRASI